MLENVLTDFEALGNGYFEVVRNRFGQGPPKAIFHVPAVTMRVRKDKKGFIQQRDNKMVYFRNFGSRTATSRQCSLPRSPSCACPWKAARR